MNTSKPTKEGELRKYKNLWSGWGTRYFKLERMYLHYFESKDAPTPVNTVTRGDIHTVKLSTSFPDKQNVFEVHTKSGVLWYLQTTSPEEMVSWMRALMPSYTECTQDEQQLPEPVEPTAPHAILDPHLPYNGPLPHIYPNLYSPGSPLHDPSVHGCTGHSPPPPYEEISHASPILEKSR
ncbi:Protein yif1b [Desmophyllum pertusum]|uniref:Protein yif1b n=1 Tax=Desmophyllum pertusum TaxID=174260 RepID=A0A9X0CTZ3_9CNID|nr:Protein yif1b [Desmophyllum pertusum]